MKKILIITILIVLIIGIVSSFTMLSDQDSTLSRLLQFKQERIEAIEDYTSSIIYTKDKTCLLDFETYEPICELCFTFTMPSGKQTTCINVPERNITIIEGNSTKEGNLTIPGVDTWEYDEQTKILDDEIVKEYVRNILHDSYPIEEFGFESSKIKDRQIEVSY